MLRAAPSCSTRPTAGFAMRLAVRLCLGLSLCLALCLILAPAAPAWAQGKDKPAIEGELSRENPEGSIEGEISREPGGVIEGDITKEGPGGVIEGEISREPGGAIEGDITRKGPEGAIEGDITREGPASENPVVEGPPLVIESALLSSYTARHPFDRNALGYGDISAGEAIVKICLDNLAPEMNTPEARECCRCGGQALYMHSTDEDLWDLVEAVWRQQQYMIEWRANQLTQDEIFTLGKELHAVYWEAYTKISYREQVLRPKSSKLGACSK